ncbi:MAG: hypothetical protein ACO1OQ_02945, partial [Rufibacter sp.]
GSGYAAVTYKQATTRKAITGKEQKPVLSESAAVKTKPAVLPEGTVLTEALSDRTGFCSFPVIAFLVVACL